MGSGRKPEIPRLSGDAVNQIIKDAATLILVRNPQDNPSVLMGKRASKAAFMPDKFVFPGGAVDIDDNQIMLADPMSEPCLTRLSGNTRSAPAFAAAAIRELWEEAGLIYGKPGDWQGPRPEGWRSYAETGNIPTARPMFFVFHAITPPGRTRRFDARFLLADAKHIVGDPDDFSKAAGELSDLQWIALGQTDRLDLAFITRVVLGEITAAMPRIAAPASVPFFQNSDEQRLSDRTGMGKTLR